MLTVIVTSTSFFDFSFLKLEFLVLRIIYIKEVSCAHTYLMDMDSIKPDTVLLVYLKSKEKVREAEQEKIKKWLAARVEQKKIKLIIE